jgi:hypothetical protein
MRDVIYKLAEEDYVIGNIILYLPVQNHRTTHDDFDENPKNK